MEKEIIISSTVRGCFVVILLLNALFAAADSPPKLGDVRNVNQQARTMEVFTMGQGGSVAAWSTVSTPEAKAKRKADELRWKEDDEYRAERSRAEGVAAVRSRPASVGQPSMGFAIPHNAQQPSVITNCDNSGCWDNLGGRYNKGAGGTSFRDDGKICQSLGGMMQCN